MIRNDLYKSTLYSDITAAVKAELLKFPKGKDFLNRWSERQIKAELKEPCFFGVKNPIKKVDFAIKHFKKIAGVQE